MKTSVFSLLICALLAFAAADSSSIRIELSSESNSNWIAVAVHNASVDTSLVHIKESGRDEWAPMELKNEYWIYAPSSGVEFPLSLILTSVNGDKVIVQNAFSSLKDIETDTNQQYPTVVVLSDRLRAHKKPTAAPTKKPTTSTTTKKPSTTTTTKKPSSSSGSSSGSSTGCSGDMKLLVPLYTYPGASWDSVASGASKVQTVAIINPSSGPGDGPDSSYNTYMSKLHSAGVEMVGYVHTSYGARALTDVKADIAKYASEFPLLVGIFIDECAATAAEVSYYTQVYNYIMSFPGWKYDIINPGTVPTSGYLAASTQIVAFEDTVAHFAASANPSFASCSNRDNFAMIAYAASSSTMQSALATAKSKGYYGWAYVTDGAAGGSTYNALSSYYASEASYIASNIN